MYYYVLTTICIIIAGVVAAGTTLEATCSLFDEIRSRFQL